MSDFSVKVVKIVNPVQDHPNADRLSLIQIGGYTCISAKLDDGSHRYKQGDLVVYVPEGAVVPEYLLKPGFWNEEKDKGILAGSKGDRVKALRLRNIFSQGILFPVEYDASGSAILANSDSSYISVKNGDDVAEHLGIIKYEPPIPIALSGEVTSIFGHTAKYDFESIQTIPDLFDANEEVIVTEKLHGTNCQIGYVPDLNNSEMFFDGNLYVGSKGLSAKGFVMINNEANSGNTYVKNLKNLLDNGFGDRIKALSERMGAPIRMFGEVYGAGIQKGFNYGHTKPSFAVFDIQIGWNFAPFDMMVELAEELGVTVVPILYKGPYDLEELVKYRDGKDSLSNSTLREGIVIKARDGSRHPLHGRKIGKWVSPDYLVKSTGEEFN